MTVYKITVSPSRFKKFVQTASTPSLKDQWLRAYKRNGWAVLDIKEVER